MALIVEDGTGLPTADSYISLADTNTRMAGFGNTTWETLSDTEKEQALRRSTVYMVQAYRDRWTGYRAHATQALDWPREGVTVDCFTYVSPSVVPVDIANACADLAFKAAAGDLAADLERAVKREKVGPLETEYESAAPQATRYRAVEMALAPYFRGASSMASLVRA